MWPLSSVQFRVAFQIVQSTETRLASWTFVRLFLTVCQKMTLEVVVSRKVRCAIRALVSFCRGRFWCVLAVSWQTHLTCRGARIRLRRKWAWKCEGAVAGVVTWVWRNELMVVLLVVLMLLRRAFLVCVGLRACGCLECACSGRSGGRIIAIAGQADRTCLHVLARDSGVPWYDNGGLGELLSLRIRLGRALWRARWAGSLRVLRIQRHEVRTCLS
jgi:hypothetical protein